MSTFQILHGTPSGDKQQQQVHLGQSVAEMSSDDGRQSVSDAPSPCLGKYVF